ncbi:MAG: LptE family protein [Bacteroidales bacterium]|nr:LptE family protein [Bacteroidales bacterium]
MGQKIKFPGWCWILTALMAVSCGIYSFTGTSIQPDVQTVAIHYFEYKALRVNPALSNDLTEAMRDKFQKLTRLEQVEENGDLELSADITGYDVKPMAVTAGEVAAQNRLTVTVKAYFTNHKHSEDDWEKSFSAYADYDSQNSLDAVESTLCEEIIEKLVEDIFNAAVANW